MTPIMLKTADVAELLGVTANTVRRYREQEFQGFPRGFRLHGRFVWNRADVEAWVQKVCGGRG